jgi:hypothetical protein
MLGTKITIALTMLASLHLCAHDGHIGIAKETKLVQKQSASVEKKHPATKKEEFKDFKAFTGKVLGNDVRLRLHADVESPIINQIDKNELLVVVGEKKDFYVVEAPSSMKVYVFRSFVLDGVAEGNGINIRLHPELTAPVVGYLSSGDPVNGKISEKNHKWIEFSPPSNVHFYIAKEYLEKVGGPEEKEIHDQKMANLTSLIDSANLFAQSEMLKPFDEINFPKITSSYSEIIEDYSEFTKSVSSVKESLGKLQEEYLQKKLSYLENKALILSKNINSGSDNAVILGGQTALTSKDRTKLWEGVEAALFNTWARSHMNKSMADFYEQQKFKSTRISGIVEAYNDPVKNKPGSYVIRDRDYPRAYLYSTMVDLHNHVGQYVTLVVSERPNNNFAFPAYFVMDLE